MKVLKGTLQPLRLQSCEEFLKLKANFVEDNSWCYRSVIFQICEAGWVISALNKDYCIDEKLCHQLITALEMGYQPFAICESLDQMKDECDADS